MSAVLNEVVSPVAGVTDGATGAPPARAGSEEPSRRRRPRLVHVDAMRPFKQVGVVTTHSLQAFVPAAGVAVGGTILLTHVTRYAFLFISAAMLVYAYRDLDRAMLATFWRRRLLAVGLPYVLWTVIYFLLSGSSLAMPHISGANRLVGSFSVDARHLGYLLITGYDQLYFLVLLFELYLLYPALLWLLRRTQRHHWWLLAGSVAVQAVITSAVHWGWVPGWGLGFWATRELWNYQLYVIAGGLMAWHYEAAHGWLTRHWRAVLAATLLAVAGGEAWYLLGRLGAVPVLAGLDPSDPFQPALIPMLMALIAVIYLLGVALARPSVPALVRRAVAAGADNSYGLYLNQVVLLSVLSSLGWYRLEGPLPWPIVVGGAVLITCAGGFALSAVLSRLPGARATAGRPRIGARPSVTVGAATVIRSRAGVAEAGAG